MPGSFDDDGQPDWDAGMIVTCLGKKRSGKSVMGLLLFRTYPYDRIVIDVAGDDGPMPGPDTHDIHNLEGPADLLPPAWPEELRRDKRPMTLRYVPDPGSPTYLEDMDHMIGLAMSHGRTAVLVHEMNVAAPSGKVKANTARMLRFNRHHNVVGIFCSPRKFTMDTLVVDQADLLYVFEMQVRRDREEIAKSIGWDIEMFNKAVTGLQAHEYVRYDSNLPKPEEDEKDYRLIKYRALPADMVADVERWAKGKTPTPVGDRPIGGVW